MDAFRYQRRRSRLDKHPSAWAAPNWQAAPSGPWVCPATNTGQGMSPAIAHRLRMFLASSHARPAENTSGSLRHRAGIARGDESAQPFGMIRAGAWIPYSAASAEYMARVGATIALARRSPATTDAL